MSSTFEIRRFFRPYQPSFSRNIKDVAYREIYPDEKLYGQIYCYWELRSLKSIETEFVYRVVADGCNDIFFLLDDPNESFAAGFYNRYTEFSIGKEFRYIGIRFLPGMFAPLFSIDAKDLINRTEKLADVSKTVSAYIRDYFSDKDTFSEIKIKLDSFFIGLFSKNSVILDSHFDYAIRRIITQSGNLRIEKDLQNSLSSRQLRRYFELYIGDSVKTFSKVIRFQQLLNAGLSTNNISKLFHDFGYYDQAHFIRDFTRMYGVTPGKAFDGKNDLLSIKTS
ncbi:MAG TPA: helix-turn-helix domain-containing protein [Spirochaetota bacterium]|nr:helix-turn-helix domain-containing protein [Spirochaetota bacterium]HQQ24421.1 helix-turn-helix domain-containing protein [Spirochaetota bacterium]